MNNQEKILVTGASGRLGGLTIEALLKAGHKNIIGTTRTPEKLIHFIQRGVEIRSADFKDPAGLEVAFKGASRLLLISTSEVGTRVLDHKNAIKAAKNAGVKYIVYTSLPNPEKSVAVVAPDHATTEKAIKESGLKYIFLRNCYYAENLFYTLPIAVQTGILYGCAGSGKVAYVLREDCANAAAGALMNAEKYENKTFDITGPKAFSYSDLAKIATENTGKKVIYKDLSPRDFKAVSMRSGLPENYAQLFTSMDIAIKDGTVKGVSDSVAILTDKPSHEIYEVIKTMLKNK